jgi:hypothetical protein
LVIRTGPPGIIGLLRQRLSDTNVWNQMVLVNQSRVTPLWSQAAIWALG